jgi:hypothetical protein
MTHNSNANSIMNQKLILSNFVNKVRAVRFEGFAAVTLRNDVFWDVTLCDCC